ncbi:MAG: hypothetical protein K6U87_06655 [Firmicutes bacterium]|nr:hypothetical protein [Bacillota bacterium]
MEIAARVAASLVWLGALGLIAVKSAPAASRWYQLQALGEAGLVAVATWDLKAPALGAVVAVIVVVKIWFIPWILRRLSPRGHSAYTGLQSLGPAATFGLATLLTGGSLWVGLQVVPGLEVVAGIVVAAWLLALLHLSLRYETWNLAWALLSVDTTSSALASLLAPQQSISLAIGVTLVGLALAVLLVWLVSAVARVHSVFDVRRLNDLKEREG